MKKKDLQSLKQKGKAELQKILNEKKLVAAKAFIDVKVSREKNLKKVKNLKHDIRQILTVIQEKEIYENIHR